MITVMEARKIADNSRYRNNDGVIVGVDEFLEFLEYDIRDLAKEGKYTMLFSIKSVLNDNTSTNYNPHMRKEDIGKVIKILTKEGYKVSFYGKLPIKYMTENTVIIISWEHDVY
jgi:hypothetical protein